MSENPVHDGRGWLDSEARTLAPITMVTVRSLTDPAIVKRSVWDDWSLAMDYARGRRQLDFAVVVQERILHGPRIGDDGSEDHVARGAVAFHDDAFVAIDRGKQVPLTRLQDLEGERLFVMASSEVYVHWVVDSQGRMRPIFCRAKDAVIPGPCVHCNQYRMMAREHELGRRERPRAEPHCDEYFYVVKCSRARDEGPQTTDPMFAVRVPRSNRAAFNATRYVRAKATTTRGYTARATWYEIIPEKGPGEFSAELPAALAQWLVFNDVEDNITFRPYRSDRYTLER